MPQLVSYLLRIPIRFGIVKLFALGTLLSLLLLSKGILFAQDDSTQTKPEAHRFKVLDSPPSVLQGDTTLPDALYLRNENGEPIFIPRIRYSEFERYLKERSGVKQVDLPSAILESIEVSGAIRDGFAEMNIVLSMSVTEATTELVRLPLAMGNMNWVSRPKASGGKTNIVAAGTDDDGLIWWVEPDGSPKYTLDLEAVVKTEKSFSESSLRFELPESAVQIKLEVPGRDLNLQWLGATGEVLQTEVLKDATQAVVRGRGGIGTLIWRDQLSSRDLGAVEVDSSTRLVRSKDGKEYHGSTRLRIVSDNRVGPRELVMRLPANAIWNPSSNSGISSHWTLDRWRPTENEGASSDPRSSIEGAGSGERLRLRLSDRGRNFVEEIPIDWTMTVDDPTSESFALMGIEVEGVQRHEGHLNIVLPTTMRFSWLPSSEYALTKQSPANDVADAIDYDFRFNRQPIRLQAVISEDDSHIRWRPDYLVTFDRDAVRLQGVLTFPTDASQLVGLKIVGGTWRLDTAVWDKTGELIPTEVAEANSIRFPPKSLMTPEDPDNDGLLTSNAPIAIRFSAFQPIPAVDVTRITFQLPQISIVVNGKRKTERGNGILVVDHGTWQIDQAETRFTGMARTAETPSSLRSLLSEPSTSDLQIFRFQTTGQDSKWTGRVRRSSRIVSATMNTNLIMRADEWRCERRWAIRSMGPAIETLPLRVPADWIAIDEETGNEAVSDRVKVTCDGVPLDMKVIQAASDGWGVIELQKSSWPDAFELGAFYREPLDLGATQQSQPTTDVARSIRIALPQLNLQPVPRIFDHHSTIESGPNLLCKIEQPTARPILCTSQDRQVSIPLTETSEAIDVEVTPWVSVKEAIVDVQRIWLQTVMNSDQCRTRCVLRLQTKQSSISFKLPPGWSEESTSLMINQRKQSLEPDVEPGVYRLVLPRLEGTTPPIILPLNNARASQSVDSEPKPLVIEFWNWSAPSDRWSKLIDAELPTILGSADSAPLVWHVILPSNEHLWTSSSTLLTDQRWVWHNLGWRRRTDVTQGQTEAEFGASVQPPITGQTNQYVFTSIGSVGAVSSNPIGWIRVIPRFALWLPVATIVLLLTALWPRMGVLRHPWMLLAVVVLLGLLSMSAPDMVIMLVQAAVASLLIVALVKLLGWASRQRVHRRSVFANRPVPGPAGRPVLRGSADDSVGTQPRIEGAGSHSTPSTHAMDASPPAPFTEVRG